MKTSLDLEQRPLDERLLAVQELYDFSAASGYRAGKPDGEDDVDVDREVDGFVGTGRRNEVGGEIPTAVERPVGIYICIYDNKVVGVYTYILHHMVRHGNNSRCDGYCLYD